MAKQQLAFTGGVSGNLFGFDTSGTVYKLLDYTPQSQVGGDETQVFETARIKVIGTSPENCLAYAQVVERVINQIDWRLQSGVGGTPTLTYTPKYGTAAEDGTTYYSYLESGNNVVWESEYTNNLLYNNCIFGNINIYRKNYWVKEPANLEIYNANGTSNGGVPVFCANDTFGTAPTIRYSYVDIAGTNVLGDTPAPAGIWFTPGGTSTDYIKYLYVHNQVEQDKDLFMPMIEMETVSAGTSTPAVGNSALYSGGSARAFTLGTALAGMATVTIGSSLISYAEGDYMAVYLTMPAGAGTDIFMRTKLNYGTVNYYTGQVTQLTTDPVQRIDIIKLPPVELRGQLYPSMSLILDAKRSGTATQLIADNIWFMPSVMSWRSYQMAGTLLSGTVNFLKDYGYLVTGYQFITDSELIFPNVITRGDLRLFPNRLNRLWFLWSSGTSYYPGDKGTILVTYNPRYRKP